MILLVTMANASYSFEKSNSSNKDNNRINNKYEGIEKIQSEINGTFNTLVIIRNKIKRNFSGEKYHVFREVLLNNIIKGVTEYKYNLAFPYDKNKERYINCIFANPIPIPNDDFLTFGSGFHDYIKRIEEIRFLTASKLSDINHTDISEEYMNLYFDVNQCTILAEVIVAIQQMRDSFIKIIQICIVNQNFRNKYCYEYSA